MEDYQNLLEPKNLKFLQQVSELYVPKFVPGKNIGTYEEDKRRQIYKIIESEYRDNIKVETDNFPDNTLFHLGKNPVIILTDTVMHANRIGTPLIAEKKEEKPDSIYAVPFSSEIYISNKTSFNFIILLFVTIAFPYST